MNNDVISLLCGLPRAGSLQQLCDLTYEITGNPAFISDLAHTILAYTKCVEIDDPIWRSKIIEGRLDRNNLKQDREVGSVHAGAGEEKKPVLVEDGFMPYPRIIKTLVRRGSAVGVFVVTAYSKPFAPEDVDLIDLIASFVAPRMEDESLTATEQARTVENYFIKLIGGPLPPERVRRSLELLGYSCAPCLYVLSVCLAPGGGPCEPEEMGQLLRSFRSIHGCTAFLYNSAIVCVYGSDEDIRSWETQAPELAELLWRENLIAGVSRRVTEISDLRTAYLQAQSTEEIGLRLGRSDRFLCYDSLASFVMLRSLPRESLGDYCHQRIQQLGAYDEAHGTELCITLQVYLEQAKSLAKTAELLYVHRNTVRYRINKCMELMNTDLEDGNEIFAYIFSLRILEYQKKIPTDQGASYHGKKL